MPTNRQTDPYGGRFSRDASSSGVLAGYQQAVSKLDSDLIKRNIKPYGKYGFTQSLPKLADMGDQQRYDMAAKAVIAKFKDTRGSTGSSPGGGKAPTVKPTPTRPAPKPTVSRKPTGPTAAQKKKARQAAKRVADAAKVAAARKRIADAVREAQRRKHVPPKAKPKPKPKPSVGTTRGGGKTKAPTKPQTVKKPTPMPPAGGRGARAV